MPDYDDERRELGRKIELSNALARLQNNPDFKKVILKGFCEEEIINLNRQASKEVTAEAKLTKSQQAQAGPVLETYLIRIENEGTKSKDDLPHLDALAREEEEPE